MKKRQLVIISDAVATTIGAILSYSFLPHPGLPNVWMSIVSMFSAYFVFKIALENGMFRGKMGDQPVEKSVEELRDIIFLFIWQVFSCLIVTAFLLFGIFILGSAISAHL